MGTRKGLWYAIGTAIADTLAEVHGSLMVRTTAAHAARAATIQVEGTHRWPTAGRIALNGATGRYSGKTGTTLTGIVADLDGDAGLPVASRSGDVVVLMDGDTDLNRLIGAFFLDRAEGPDLDVYGRNHGWDRPFGLTDDTYRALLKVVLYLDATTEYAFEKVLDVLVGAGNYEIIEHFPSELKRVYINVGVAPGDTYRGKFFLCGGEEQPQTSPTTVDVDYEPVIVYGVWDAADVDRAGTNYALQDVAVTEVAGTNKLRTAGPFWTGADQGRSVELVTGETWWISAVLDPQNVQVGRPERSDASLNPGAPGVVTLAAGFFRPWMVGHKIRVKGTLNAGTYEILEVRSPTEALTDAASWHLELAATWALQANFTGAANTARVSRVSWAGVTVTTPVAMPATVLVDYATIPSGELKNLGEDGNGQYPGYLWDQTALVQSILDKIKESGTEVIVEAS